MTILDGDHFRDVLDQQGERSASVHDTNRRIHPVEDEYFCIESSIESGM